MSDREKPRDRAEVDRFILEHVDSVPHLEALLLLWQHQSEHWTVASVARRLWIDVKDARSVLQDLVREHLVTLVTGGEERFQYQAEPNNDRLVRAVSEAYREEMIRISRMIHAKPSSAVQAFARAFRFTKGQE